MRHPGTPSSSMGSVARTLVIKSTLLWRAAAACSALAAWAVLVELGAAFSVRGTRGGQRGAETDGGLQEGPLDGWNARQGPWKGTAPQSSSGQPLLPKGDPRAMPGPVLFPASPRRAPVEDSGPPYCSP